MREEAADGRDRNVLAPPVLVEAVHPPLGFRSLQAADLTAWRDEEQHPGFQQLLQDIRSSLGASEPRSPPHDALDRRVIIREDTSESITCDEVVTSQTTQLTSQP